MGVTKTENFTKEQNEIAIILKAMAHPARIAIVEYLLSVNTCICNDIVAEIPLSQSTISQHLKELKNAEIIKGNIEGNSICYCLNPASFKKMEYFLNKILHNTEIQNKCC